MVRPGVKAIENPYDQSGIAYLYIIERASLILGDRDLQRPIVLISPLLATSILNQAELIKKLLQQKGFDVLYKTTISTYDIRNDNVYATLWISLCTIQHIGDAVWPFIYSRKPKAVYVTIEGIPTKANVLYSNLPKLAFIANSNFTAMCLKDVGLTVIDVVHHAIDKDQCEAAMKAAEPLRKKFENQFKDKCKLLYVGRDDPRKALNYLAEAMRILIEKGRRDFVLILHAPKSVREKLQFLEDYGCLYYHGDFGSLPMIGVLRLMHACDYLVFPSRSEGFGLPVLEANAVARPAIHCWFPPLSEFSSKDFNFVFDYIEERFVKCSGGQYWIFHEYLPEMLADMIAWAIDIWKNSKQEYEEYCVKAKEHAWRWDYRIIYPRLLYYLGIK